MSKETGGPAFPYSGIHYEGDRGIIVDSHGMTIRDYFAAKAMQGMLRLHEGHHPQIGAEQSYVWADEMLKARNKVEEEV